MSKNNALTIQILSKKTKNFITLYATNSVMLQKYIVNISYVNFLDLIARFNKSTNYNEYIKNYGSDQLININDFIDKLAIFITELQKKNNEYHKEENEIFIKTLSIYLKNNIDDLNFEIKKQILDALNHNFKIYSVMCYINTKKYILSGEFINNIHYFNKKDREDLITFMCHKNALFIKETKNINNMDFMYKFLFLLNESYSRNKINKIVFTMEDLEYNIDGNLEKEKIEQFKSDIIHYNLKNLKSEDDLIFPLNNEKINFKNKHDRIFYEILSFELSKGKNKFDIYNVLENLNIKGLLSVPINELNSSLLFSYLENEENKNNAKMQKLLKNHSCSEIISKVKKNMKFDHNNLWHEKAISLLELILSSLIYKRDHLNINFGLEDIIAHTELNKIHSELFLNPILPAEICGSIGDYLNTLPDFDIYKKIQEKITLEQHGMIKKIIIESLTILNEKYKKDIIEGHRYYENFLKENEVKGMAHYNISNENVNIMKKYIIHKLFLLLQKTKVKNVRDLLCYFN